MMLIALVAAGAVSQTIAPATEASQRETVQQVIACGIPERAVTVDRSTSGPLQQISIATQTPLTSEQLLCVARVADTSAIWIDLRGPSQGVFELVHGRLIEARDLAKAGAWLVERGLFDKVPTYSPASDKPQILARQLETLCGATPGSVLVWDGSQVPARGSVLTDASSNDEKLDCVFNAARVAGLPID